MRFQRYPDGGARWTWFIWGRHPRNSLTWTHSLTLTRDRGWPGIVPYARVLPKIIRPWDRQQRAYGIQWLGFQLQLLRQDAMTRTECHAPR
jgi:hypothetical protein